MGRGGDSLIRKCCCAARCAKRRPASASGSAIKRVLCIVETALLRSQYVFGRFRLRSIAPAPAPDVKIVSRIFKKIEFRYEFFTFLGGGAGAGAGAGSNVGSALRPHVNKDRTPAP